MSDINIRDLRTIKGLGPRKAQVIKEVLDARPDGEVTADDLATIQGVSPRMAKAVVKLVKSGGSAEAATEKEAAIKPGSTRTKTSSKTNKTKKAAATNGSKTNGHTEVKAREVRILARQAEAVGFHSLASDLRSRAAAKLDDEVVSVPN